MTVKQFLYSVRNEAIEIKELQMRIDQLDDSAKGLKGMTYDGVKVQSSPQDRMQDKIVDVVELKEQLIKKYNDLAKNRKKAQAMIDKLTDTRERQVLDIYFLSVKRPGMKDVAVMLNYSQRQAYRFYVSAMEHLERWQ